MSLTDMIHLHRNIRPELEWLWGERSQRGAHCQTPQRQLKVEVLTRLWLESVLRLYPLPAASCACASSFSNFTVTLFFMDTRCSTRCTYTQGESSAVNKYHTPLVSRVWIQPLTCSCSFLRSVLFALTIFSDACSCSLSLTTLASAAFRDSLFFSSCWSRCLRMASSLCSSSLGDRRRQNNVQTIILYSR